MRSECTHGITHTWGAWRLPRVMKILTFATRLKMKAYRGWQAHRLVREELLKRFRILICSDPGWIHRILVAEEATCHSSTKCFSTKDKGRMMLRFRGSNCRRSWGLTWYNWMDSLLMDLGFTESKAHSNLCFKVEGGRPVMLLLYDDDLFLTEKRNSLKFQEGDLLSSSRWRTWIWCTIN